MILLNDLGDGYPTFPQFQRMLIEYEAEQRRQRTTPPPVRNIMVDAFLRYPSSPQQQQALRAEVAEHRVWRDRERLERSHTCLNCGHPFELKPDATDLICSRCRTR